MGSVPYLGPKVQTQNQVFQSILKKPAGWVCSEATGITQSNGCEINPSSSIGFDCQKLAEKVATIVKCHCKDQF